MFFSANIHAQTVADYWYFGDSAGIHFTPNGVVSLTDSKSIGGEVAGSWSTSEGEFLFYTDREKVFNRQHNVMPNGAGVIQWAYQTPVIVPNPANAKEFNIFSLRRIDPPWPQEPFCRLYHTVISMDLDGGMGDVTQGKKMLVVHDTLAAFMTSYPKCDGGGRWLFVRDAFGPKTYVYSVSDTGIDNTPQAFNGFTTNTIWGTIGEVAISPDGKTLATIQNQYDGRIEFFKFDNATGMLSDPFTVPVDTFPMLPLGGLEFSPSSRFLYVACREYITGSFKSNLLQLDVSVYDSAVISSSVETIAEKEDCPMFNLATGPDGRIYISPEYCTSLHRINHPDQLGAACGFEEDAVVLEKGRARWVLPQFTYEDLLNPFGARVICHGDTAWFGFDDSCHTALLWDFGDPASGAMNTSTADSLFHVFSDTGVYTVTLTVNYTAATKNRTATIRVVPTDLPDLFPDTVVACDSTIRVDYTLVDYLWSIGATTQSIRIDSSGYYSVTVSNPCDTAVDSVYVLLYPTPPPVQLPPDTVLCGGATSLALSIAPTDSVSYRWSDSTTGTATVIDTSYTHGFGQAQVWLTASNICGSTGDTLLVTFLPVPTVVLPPDSVQCHAGVVSVPRPNVPFVNYQWSNGSTGATLPVDTTDTVWLEASNLCGTVRDTFALSVYPKIGVNLGGDTVMCEGDTVALNASWQQAAYQWSTGTADSILLVFAPGIYTVTVSVPPCSVMASRKLGDAGTECDTLPCVPYVPNVFTPNGDNTNEMLAPHLCNDVGYTIEVFSRWGTMVFSGQYTPNATTGMVGWDGTVNGRPADEGVYFIIVTFADGTRHEGSASLLR